ncbi:MAG: hypothetical protein US66_C0018G0019, partial [Candidatus Moranbacteria bacterium GW2011_GWD2_37_9]
VKQSGILTKNRHHMKNNFNEGFSEAVLRESAQLGRLLPFFF